MKIRSTPLVPVWLFSLLVLAIGLSLPLPAHSATGLLIICDEPSAEGKLVADAAWAVSCPAAKVRYDVPSANSLVRTHPTGVDWNNQNETWAKYSTVARAEGCATDIPAGATFTEADEARKCRTWQMYPVQPQGPPSFVVSPKSGTAPLAVTVTWSVADGSNCQAGGAWSGAKANTGTEVVTLSAAGSFALTCSRPGPPAKGSASLSWTLPTLNTDDSPLSNLKGVNIYRGNVPPPGNLVTMVAAPATTYVDANLDPGSYVYELTALNLAGVESSRSATGTKVVASVPTVLTWSAEPQAVAVTAIARPRAPANFVVQ